MKRWRGLFGLLIPLSAACQSDGITETVIIVEAQPAVRDRTDHTTLVVTKDPAGVPVEVHSNLKAPRPAQFPYVIALYPGQAAADQLYRVEVTALEKGRPLALARLVSGYVAHQTRYVRLWLEDACIDGPTCSSTQTCHAGACIDATVAPSDFSAAPDDAPASFDRSSSISPSSGAFDSSSGTTVDAGSDQSASDASAGSPSASSASGSVADAGAAGDSVSSDSAAAVSDPRDSAPDAATAVVPDAAGALSACTRDEDCAALGVGATCSNQMCLAPSAPSQCTSDSDCDRLGPEFVGGKCENAVCLPNPRWRCERPAAALGSQPLELTILLRDSLSLDPIPNARVLVCNKSDLDCAAPVTESTAKRDGTLVFTVAGDFAGYLQVEAARFAPAQYLLPPTLPGDGKLQPFPLLGASVFDALALSLDTELNPQRGHLMLVAQDCMGASVAGATFDSPQRDASTTQFYVHDLLPSVSALETGPVGNGGYFNFPAGSAAVTVSLRQTGLKLTTRNLTVKPRFIIVAYIAPDAR